MTALRNLLAALRPGNVVVSSEYLASLHKRIEQADKRAQAQKESRARRAAQPQSEGATPLAPQSAAQE